MLAHHKLGYRKDKPDERDLIFAPSAAPHALPALVDLSTSPAEAPIFDQTPLASCSANAISAMFHFNAVKEALPPIIPSRLFIYYNERQMEGTTATDSGAQIRDGMKAVARWGVCSEDAWPYVAANLAVAPPQPCYAEALANKAIRYSRISGNLQDLKGCLAEGYPFVFGMSIYTNFFTPQVAKTGIGPMPGPSDALKGGHAVTAVGYDDSKQTFLIRNSCGTGWGMRGYFTLPYAFMSSRKLADDFWTLRRVQ